MTQFAPQSFFELSDFAHSSLFHDTKAVWEALAKLKDYLAKQELGQILGEVSDQAYLIDPHLITIGEGSVVEPGAYIKGPCVIGRDCQIRHGAYIRGQVLTGDRCVIGHATEVKNSIFLNKAQAAHFAYVGDSILGNHCNLGAGTKCANLKLVGDEVVIHHEGKRYPSGLRKFGAIIGDAVQIGCNSVTNPGTLMGKASGSYPCVTVQGVIPEGKILRPQRNRPNERKQEV